MSELREWNRAGLIPGPNESEEAFFSRVREGEGQRVELFDIAPVVEVERGRLAPWHGGMTVIEGDTVTIKIRKKSEEVLAHELCHVGRMAFDEPRFEEMLAYQTSRGVRRFLGPIVQHTWETSLFLATIGVSVVGDLLGWTLWLKALPMGLIGFGLVRLMRKRRVFFRCLKRLSVWDRPWAVIYRLTDGEIEAFSRMSQEEVVSFTKRQNCLRWQMIRAAYTLREPL